MPRISQNPYYHKIYIPQTKKNSYYFRNMNSQAQSRKLNQEHKQAQQRFELLNEFVWVKQFSLFDQLALFNRYPRNAVEYLIFLSLVCLLGRLPTSEASSDIPQEKFNNYKTLKLGTVQQFNMAVSLVDSASVLTPAQHYHVCSSALLGYEVYGYSLAPAYLKHCVLSLSNIRSSLNVIGPYVGFGKFIADYRSAYEEGVATTDLFQYAGALFELEADRRKPTFSTLDPLLYIKSSIQFMYTRLSEQSRRELDEHYQPALMRLHDRHAVYDLPHNIESYTSKPWGSLAQYKAALRLSSLLTVSRVPRELQEGVCGIIEIGKIHNHIDKIKNVGDPLFSTLERFPLRAGDYAIAHCPSIFLEYYRTVQAHLRNPKTQIHYGLFVYTVGELDKALTLDERLLASSIFTFTEWMDLELKNSGKSFVGDTFIKFATRYLNQYGEHVHKFDFELPKLQQQFELVKAKYSDNITSDAAKAAYTTLFVSLLVIFVAYWRRQNNIEPNKKNEQRIKVRPEKKVEKKRKMSRIEDTAQIIVEEEHIDASTLLRDIDANLKEIERLIKCDTFNDEELNRKHVVLKKRQEQILSLKDALEAHEELNKLSLAAYQSRFDALVIDSQFISKFEQWAKKISNHSARVSQKEREAELQEKSDKQAETYANNQRSWREGHNSTRARTSPKEDTVTRGSARALVATSSAATSPIPSSMREKVDLSPSFFRPRRPSEPTFSFAELFPVRPDMIYLQNARRSLECMHVLCAQEKQDLSQKQVQLGLLYNLMRFHHVLGIFQRRYFIRNLPIDAETAYTIRNMIRHGYFIEEYNDLLVPYATALYKTFYTHLVAAIEKGTSLVFPSLKYAEALPFAEIRNEDIRAYQQNSALIIEDIRASLKIMGALYKFRAAILFDEDISLHSAIKMLINIIGENLKLAKKTDIFDMPEWKCFNRKQRDILLKTKHYANLIGHHFDKEGEAIKEQQAQPSTISDEPEEHIFEEITLPQLEEIAQMAMSLMEAFIPEMDTDERKGPSFAS
ncbi:hypothetical protein J2N86_04995 [Legionella lytica]|uniref:Uncharacterized protein n=1 Tax=Legionella lytica TaxID=96232 RepID=A0ABY4YAL3_9GAMM|nr:hypothetical protein [Legionella lytica]USQ14664.1 hypothetical protein J2N86_04995 [Legionella lytica]